MGLTTKTPAAPHPQKKDPEKNPVNPAKARTGLPTYLVADLFCGAGGTTTGAARAAADINAEIDLVAVNHWPIAIETHKKNHPKARHYVQNLEGTDPEEIVPEGRLDLLMASPECRFYSRARGGKPMNDQQRMNPWIIQRWLTSLNIRTLLIENVPEFVDWGPLDENKKPDKNHKGLYFEEWVRSLWGLGYEVQWRNLNAADYGEATTRVRFFLQARNDGRPIVWPEASHTKSGDASLLSQMPRWRGAREIIDWSNPGRSLIDDPKYRKKPLSENTRRRIARGLKRFGGPLAPLYIRLLDLPDHCDEIKIETPEETPQTGIFHGSDRKNTAARNIAEPVPTITTLTGGGCYLVQAVAQPMENTNGHNLHTDRDAENTPRTAEAQPFLLGQQSGGSPRSTDEPIPTITADGAISLIQPMVSEYYGKGESRSVSAPLSTITTKARHGLTQPVLIGLREQPRAASTEPEKKAQRPHTFVVPNFGERKGQKPRVHDIDRPMPTVTSRGAGSLVSPVMARPTAKQLKTADPKRIILINDRPYLLDIRYRMLQNPELARAMGFSDEESEYEFVGNITEITKQIGNAVPVRLAAALVKAILKQDSPEKNKP